jgi:hypothetical protein
MSYGRKAKRPIRESEIKLPKVDPNPSANPVAGWRIGYKKGGETEWTTKPPKKPPAKKVKGLVPALDRNALMLAKAAREAEKGHRAALEALKSEIAPHERKIYEVARDLGKKPADLTEKFRAEADANLKIATERIKILQKIQEAGAAFSKADSPLAGIPASHTELYATHKDQLQTNLTRAAESIGSFRAKKGKDHPEAERLRNALVARRTEAKPYIEAMVASIRRSG